jgi:ketosteroid isomerase-like protein
VTDDASQIRYLVERWALAVRSRDLTSVIADHADDIVMFDVPPPEDGVRGIDAYRASWLPFFDWLASGGSFDIVELDVTVGETVGYAYALLRCATADELAAHPDDRLRLSIGLRKEGGRWVVAHEHHSYTSKG